MKKKVTIEIDESSDRIDSDFDNKLQNPSHLVSTNYALDPSFPKDRIMNFKIPKRQLEAISVKSNKTLSSKKKKETNFVKAKDLDNESIKRFVKAKCPECNHVFSTKILAKNRELVCPECGFVGEY